MDTGKAVTDHNAFKIIAKVKLTPIDENIEVHLVFPPNELASFSKQT